METGCCKDVSAVMNSSKVLHEPLEGGKAALSSGFLLALQSTSNTVCPVIRGRSFQAAHAKSYEAPVIAFVSYAVSKGDSPCCKSDE